MSTIQVWRWWLLPSLLAAAVATAAPLAPQTDTDKSLAQAREYGRHAIEAFDRDSLQEALQWVQKKVAIERDLGAAGQTAVLESLTMFADIYEEGAHPGKRSLDNPKDCFAKAQKARLDALDFALKSFPAQPWHATDARLALDFTKQAAKLTEEQFRDLANLRYEENKILGKSKMRSGSLGMQLCEINSVCRIQGGGIGHSKATAGSVPFAVRGAAENTLRYVLEIREKLLGKDHPHCAASWNNLGALYYGRGDLTAATAAFQQAETIQLKHLGVNHPRLATTRGNLALVHQIKGDFAAALKSFREVLAIVEATAGKESTACATALNNLAGACVAVGDLQEAEDYYRRAVAIYSKDLSANAADCALCLNNAASMYEIHGDIATAENHWQQAADLLVKHKQTSTLEYAVVLSNLAMLNQGQQQYAKAAPLHDKSLAILYGLPGGANVADIALTKNNQALLQQAQGKLDAAEKLFREVYKIRTEQLLQEDHPAVAVTLTNLAGVYEQLGQSAQAETQYQKALRISRKNLELAAFAQSERQQLAMLAYLRKQLDAYLSLHLRGRLDLAQAYEQVLPWKGAVFARQQLVRLGRTPEEAKLIEQLRETSAKLANRAFVQPPDGEKPQWQKELVALSQDYEALAAKLANLNHVFLQRRSTSVADLQQALPKDRAFVDFLEYTHFTPARPGRGSARHERRIVAFVVRHDSFHAVELGASLPVDRAIEAWRKEIAGKGSIDNREPPGKTLGKLVWQPLQPYLKGCNTVLVAPDGSLTRMPFAALPGKTAGSYLIEDLAVAVVSVPQLLPEQFAKRDDSALATPSLLLVGNVDYGDYATVKDGGDSRSSGHLLTTLGPWRMLPGTKGEIESIQQAFKARYGVAKVTALAHGEASETGVRALASKYRWLHFATHGFFAPPHMRSSLEAGSGMATARQADVRDLLGFHPALLSGLVLAGANRPADPAKDDGILTALEVADLNLCQAELVVLSACETGLGEVAGGEGVLGLQRAFQVAGARTVIATLWTIPDSATRDLMEQFYAHLLAKDHTITKLEALRKAQLWMLREGPKHSPVVRGGNKPSSITFDADPTPGALPYYWAAFVLSGDVR
jgi:CHAT domain-containing protein/Flp pilus assembly protein TadD